MIAYEKLPLDNEVKAALEGLEIEYVFQPIFYKDCVRIYAYEALMRPKKMTVGQLIDEFARDEKLHILEVATFFGATQAYIERGYQEYLCINSFPSESFTENEAEAFDTYFGNQKGKRIIEILEYPKVSLREWVRKSEMVQNKHWKVSLDDFGMGENNMNAVYLYTPDIVKLDRSLICGIDNDARKQENVRTYLESSMKEECRCLRKVWRQEKSVIFYGLWEWICFRDTIWLCRHKYKKRACESTFFF